MQLKNIFPFRFWYLPFFKVTISPSISLTLLSSILYHCQWNLSFLPVFLALLFSSWFILKIIVSLSAFLLSTLNFPVPLYFHFTMTLNTTLDQTKFSSSCLISSSNGVSPCIISNLRWAVSFLVYHSLFPSLRVLLLFSSFLCHFLYF